MEFEVQETNSYTRKINIKINPQELSAIEQKVIREFQKTAQIPGFRRGKVPPNIIKNRYADSIKAEIIEKAIGEFYGKALDEAKINPVSQGQISNLQFEEVQQGMEVEVEVEVEPEVEIKKYRGLKVEKEIQSVTEKMVDEVLKNLQENYATVKEAEIVEKGTQVTMDAQELGEGNMPVIGRKIEDIQIEVGSGNFDAELEEEIIGLKAGEKTIVRKESPPPPDSKSKEPVRETYEILIKSVKEKELPELNDEFVKNLGEGDLENLEQLRNRIRENLKIDLQRRSEDQFRQRLIDELLKSNAFDVPQTMVNHYLDHIVEDIQKQSKGERLDEKVVRQNYRPQAIHNIRWYLMKKKLAEVENIEVSIQELHELIDKSSMEEQHKKVFKQSSQYLDQLKDDLLEQKILKMLESHADVVEVYPQQPGTE